MTAIAGDGRPRHGYHTRLPRAERERQMLDAAHALFAARGYAGVTMDDVADEVGVTKPLLYNYFGNKEQLYLACMEPVGEALVAAALDAIAPTKTAAEALEAGLRAFFGFLAEDRAAWRVLFDESVPSSGVVAQRVAEYRERLGELVATALLAQTPAARRDRARLEVEAVSTAVLGAAEALARWWLRTDAIAPQDAADLLIRTLTPGLGGHAQTTESAAAPASRKKGAS